MPTRATDRQDVETARRAHRLLTAAAITLAAVGAPIFMQGAVALANELAPPTRSTVASPIEALLTFILSAAPLVLAWLAWRKTQRFRSSLDQELWVAPREPSS